MSGNAVQESDSSLKKITPRKSPMKINEVEEKERTLKVWDCGSPLYDSYELVSVSHIIERKFMVFPYLSKSRNVNESSLISSSSSAAAAASVDQSESSRAAGSSKVRGFSLVSFLSDLVEGDFWKGKQLDGERKVNCKPKKHKRGDISPISQSSSTRKSNCCSHKICTRIGR